MRYAIFLAAVAALFWWALASGNLPDLPPEARIAAAPPAEAPPLPLEPVRRGIRDVSPEGSVRMPLAEDGLVARLPAAAPPPPAPRKPKPQVYSRPQVIEAGVVRAGGRTLRLAGIEPVAADRRCGAAPGEWPCGAFARTALQRFLRQRTLDCEAGGEETGGALVTRCSVQGRDVASWLVAQGWAEAVDATYAQAETEAKANRLGVWGDGPGRNDPPAPTPD